MKIHVMKLILLAAHPWSPVSHVSHSATFLIDGIELQKPPLQKINVNCLVKMQTTVLTTDLFSIQFSHDTIVHFSIKVSCIV